MLEPREIALLQTLGHAGRLTAEQARALAQTLEAARAQGGRPNLVEILVARRVATAEEIERFLRSPRSASGRAPLPWTTPAPPAAPADSAEDAESPTHRFADATPTEKFPPGTPPLPLPTGPTGTIRGMAPPFPAPMTLSLSSGSGSRSGEARPPSSIDASSFASQSASGLSSDDAPRTANAQGIGPYRFEAQIGTGRSGTVYRARHATRNRVCALKLLNAPDLARPELDRILREARAAQWLRHPNVVAVHEVGEVPGGPGFIVTDFVEGPSLAAEIAAKNLDAGAAARIVSRVALALQSAHDQGIVHRDVTPSNIIIDASGEPFLADFGLAREIAIGDGSRIVGTPEYVAPEQASGEAAPSRRSDVYSLGAVLYEALTFRPPFQGSSPAEVARQVVGQRPRPVKRLASTVPADLALVCERALAKRPEERYATARELAEDLRRFLDGRPVQARAQAPVGSRAIVLAAVAALGAVGLVAAGAGGVLLWRKRELDRRVLEVRTALERHDLALAEARARTLVRDEPRESRAHRLLARALLEQRRTADASEEARLAAQGSHDAPEDLLVVGETALACERTAEARAALEKALAPGTLAPLDEARDRAALAGIPGLAPDAARAHVKRALDLAPADPRVAVACGRALLALEDAKGALAALERSRATSPDDPGLATVHGLAVAASGDAKGGLAELDGVVAQKPELVEARVARARLRLAAGELEPAFEDAVEAERLGARGAAAPLVATLAKAWLGAREEAASRLEELEKVAPAAPETALARAEVLSARNQPDDAIAGLSEAEKASPAALLLLCRRAMNERIAGHPDAARTSLEGLLSRALAPGARWLPAGADGLVLRALLRRYGLAGPEASARALRAELLIQTKHPDDARRELAAATRLEDVAPRLALVEACLAKDVASGLATLDRALATEPALAELHALRASFRLQMGQIAPALEELNALVRLEPSNAGYRTLRANAYATAFRFPEALADLEEAERLSARPPASLLGEKALVLQNLGRRDDARRAAERGLALDPKDAQCLFARGLVRFQKNDAGFDDDLVAALAVQPESLAWRLTRAQLLTYASRPTQADADLTNLLDERGPRLNTVFRAQVLLGRAQARVLTAGKAREALEDLRVADELLPNQPTTCALRAFARALVGDDEYVEDVKRVAGTADPRLQEMFLATGQLAVSLKLPGPWERHLVALANVTQRPDVRLQALRIAAYGERALGDWDELEAAARRILAVAPGDQDARALLDLAHRRGRTP